MAAVLFDPYIERSPAYNVAYWNLDQRSLGITDDVVTVDGSPLKFFHFSGFNPAKPWWLSKHHPVVPRNLVSSSSALTVLCDDYGQRVSQSQDNMGLSTPYRWNEAFPGVPLTAPLRRYRGGCHGIRRPSSGQTSATPGARLARQARGIRAKGSCDSSCVQHSWRA